jgi:carbamoyl-phosphate synthase large subunit
MTAVLFTSAGRRVELLNCFRDGQTRILAADMEPDFSAACASADGSFKVPRCTDASYIPTLLEICRKEGVKLLVPTIDTELEALAEAQKEFAALGTRVHVSDLEVVRMARHKGKTAEFLTRNGIPTPRTATVAEVIGRPESFRWPVILKPAGGSSSIGIQIAHDFAEFKAMANRLDYIAQELWKGREFTVNIFFDQQGILKCAIPHWRKETRGGEVSKGITWRHPVLMDLAERIGRALKGARGALCFQAIVGEDGSAAVFEINARFGGGYPLAHRAGATFAHWLLEEVRGFPCTANNDWQDRLMMLRFDDAVFSAAPANL